MDRSAGKYTSYLPVGQPGVKWTGVQSQRQVTALIWKNTRLCQEYSWEGRLNWDVQITFSSKKTRKSVIENEMSY